MEAHLGERVQALELLLATVVDAYVPAERRYCYTSKITSTLSGCIAAQQISLRYLLDKLALLEARDCTGLYRAREILLRLVELYLDKTLESQIDSYEELDDEILLHQKINSKFSEMFIENAPLLQQLEQRDKQIQTDRADWGAEDKSRPGSQYSRVSTPVMARTTAIASSLRSESSRSTTYFEPLQRSDYSAKYKVTMLEERIRLYDETLRRQRTELQTLRRQCLK